MGTIHSNTLMINVHLFFLKKKIRFFEINNGGESDEYEKFSLD